MRMFLRKSSWGLSFIIVIALVLAGTRSHLSAANTDNQDNQNLVGSWNAVVTATNPPSLPPLKDLITFTPGGGVIETRRLYNPLFGFLLATPGHGAWERTAGNQFAATIVVFH